MQGADDPPLGFQLQAASLQPVQPGLLEDSPGGGSEGQSQDSQMVPGPQCLFCCCCFLFLDCHCRPPNLDQLWSTACPGRTSRGEGGSTDPPPCAGQRSFLTEQ